MMRNGSYKDKNLQREIDAMVGKPYPLFERIRPGGIILTFRSLLESFGWIVPFPKLNIIKSGNIISLYPGKDFIRLTSQNNSNIQGEFIRRLLRIKAEAAGNYSPLD